MADAKTFEDGSFLNAFVFNNGLHFYCTLNNTSHGPNAAFAVVDFPNPEVTRGDTCACPTQKHLVYIGTTPSNIPDLIQRYVCDTPEQELRERCFDGLCLCSACREGAN